MLGAALWFLDYVKQEAFWEELIPLLPSELDDEIDFATPAADDLAYSQDHMLGLMTVFIERKGKRRRAFRKIWGLIDRENYVSLCLCETYSTLSAAAPGCRS